MKELARQLVALALGERAQVEKLTLQVEELKAQVGERDETITILRDGIAALQPFDASANKGA